MTNRIIGSLLAGIVMLTVASCKKNIDKIPQQPDTSSYLQFSTLGIQQSNVQLYALLSMETNNGQVVFTNKKVTIDEVQGVYKTDKIKLARGDYKLTRFIVVKASDTAAYAIPLVNTAKAAESANPLPVAVPVNKKGINNAALQVLKIMGTDAAESYGYTKDDFGFQPYINLRLKLKINVGQVAYDNLPGQLAIDATNAEGKHWIRQVDLQKGINTIRVPEQYSVYKFEVAKWNTLAQSVVNRAAVQENMLIALEAARQPKRLIKEESFIENVAGLVPDSRTEYFYNGANRLSEIRNYQKSTVVSGLPLTNVYKFVYDGGQLDSIKRFDGNSASTGFTAFTYESGRIQTILNRSYDQQTSAFIEYTGAGENEVISGDYLFHNGHTMNYKFTFTNGNKTSDHAQTSTGGNETGVYEYDDHINPKHQLGWDDLYFTNYSKSNLSAQQKNYAGGFPTVVPYKFEYTYDNDGYPAEVFISYKGFTTGQHLYRVKRVYYY